MRNNDKKDITDTNTDTNALTYFFKEIPNIRFTFPNTIICRCVPDFVACSAWCRGLTTCLCMLILFLINLFQMSWSLNLIKWRIMSLYHYIYIFQRFRYYQSILICLISSSFPKYLYSNTLYFLLHRSCPNSFPFLIPGVLTYAIIQTLWTKLAIYDRTTSMPSLVELNKAS